MTVSPPFSRPSHPIPPLRLNGDDSTSRGVLAGHGLWPFMECVPLPLPLGLPPPYAPHMSPLPPPSVRARLPPDDSLLTLSFHPLLDPGFLAALPICN